KLVYSRRIEKFSLSWHVTCILIDEHNYKGGNDMSTPVVKTDTVDFYHGREIRDPYRWLEESTHPDTEAWADNQNQRTRTYFDSLTVRNTIQKKLAGRWDTV